MRKRLALASLALGLLALPAIAADAPTLSGSWTASGLSEKWSVGEWGDVCGPKPKASGAPGGSVQIADRGGELSIIGAGRAFTTSECWEQMPGLSRSSHSASSRFWRTKCNSAPNDSRRTSIVTTMSATDSSIQMNEQGTYEFDIQGAKCNASVVRSRSFTLVKREGEEPAPVASASATPSAVPSAVPAATPLTPKPERPVARCNGSPGEPARLEVTPSKKLLRAGDKFTFKATVLDDAGCAVAERPRWSILPGPLADKVTIDKSGEISAPADVEGKLEVSVKVGDKGVVLPVEVASAASYDGMLASSGLDANGESSDAAIAVIATSALGGKTSKAEDSARERKTIFIVIVAALAVSFGFAGLVLVRRGKKPLAPVEVEEEEEIIEVVGPGEVERPAGAPKKAKEPRVKAAARGKICPTCGERYGSEAGFCGKDSTKLVVLN